MEDYNSGAKNGETLTTVRQCLKQEHERFIPIPVDINTLTMQEKEVYNKTDAILKLIGGIPKNVRNIIIVEKIYESEALNETLGLWVPIDNSIIIKRNQLKSIKQYSGTLLHECAHAISGKDDLNRGFELELTEILGIISSKFV